MASFGQVADSSNVSKNRGGSPADKAHQLRVGIDLSRPVMNIALKTRKSYEFEVDYHIRKEIYAVLEGGWGSTNFDFADLKYTSSNAFVRVGVDKTMLPRLFPGDWDMAFVGGRLGTAIGRRDEASFITTSNFWGTTSSTVPAADFSLYWIELNGGVRAELFHGCFVGWNVRAKFLLNQNAIEGLKPNFIAGYGKGDKVSNFDFNVWLCYALRW